MRFWIPRLLCAIVLTPVLATGQDLRIVSQESAGQDLRAVLVRGDALKQNKQWRELASHYKQSLKTFPGSKELLARLHEAEAHEDVQRRYADASFRGSIRTLTDREAIDLYSELLAKVQSHYVDDPAWQTLVRRGLVYSLAALEEDKLRGMTPAITDAHFRSLQQELRRYLASRPITNVRDAREAAWFAGQLTKKRTGLPAPALILEFVAGATAALDTYSSFLTPDQLDEVFSQIEGNFVGLGIELETLDDALRIVNVIPGGPAATAGIRANDRIVEIDGSMVSEMGSNAAANALRGEEGSTVSIVIARENEVTRRLRVVRRLVEVPSVVDIKIIDKKHGVGYFKLTSFQKSTNSDVDNALWTLHKQGLRSLIIDLRGNPGGLLDAAVQVADKFLPAGAIVSTRGRTEKFEFKAHREGTWSVPLIVLIDSDSASASEILAGALRDHQRAQVVGTRSYGKGSVQGIFPLSIGKAGIRLTTAKFYSPSGRAISNNGVLPTTIVRSTAKAAVGGAVAKGNAAKGDAAKGDAVLLSAMKAARDQLVVTPVVSSSLSAR